MTLSTTNYADKRIKDEYNSGALSTTNYADKRIEDEYN